MSGWTQFILNSPFDKNASFTTLVTACQITGCLMVPWLIIGHGGGRNYRVVLDHWDGKLSSQKRKRYPHQVLGWYTKRISLNLCSFACYQKWQVSFLLVPAEFQQLYCLPLCCSIYLLQRCHGMTRLTLRNLIVFVMYLARGVEWGEWTAFGKCSRSCAGGDWSRQRINWIGFVEVNSQNCNNFPCPGELL